MTQLEYDKACLVSEINDSWIFHEARYKQEDTIIIDCNDDLSISVLQDSNGAMMEFLDWFSKYIRAIKFKEEKSDG